MIWFTCNQIDKLQNNPIYTDQSIERDWEKYESIDFNELSLKLKKTRGDIQKSLRGAEAPLTTAEDHNSVSNNRQVGTEAKIKEEHNDLMQSINTYKKELSNLKNNRNKPSSFQEASRRVMFKTRKSTKKNYNNELFHFN